MPSHVELATVELPGRGRRFGEQLIGSLPCLVRELRLEIERFTDCPYVFFGHSIGALIAFELCRSLAAQRSQQPELLIVSGKRAPQLAHIQRLHDLPDAQLIEALKEYNGTPVDVLHNEELMELLLPILRADFSLAETYVYEQVEALRIPIRAFGGIGDTGVKAECVEQWRSHTSSSFRYEMMPGDHFFLNGATGDLLRSRVLELLRQVSSPADLASLVA